MIFRQLFDKETSTFTYLLADSNTKEGIIIDTVKEQVERDLTVIKELNITLKYILETHLHADHITGASFLRKKTGAKIAISKVSSVTCANILLEDNDELSFGNLTIKALYTPGHTKSCMSFYGNGMIFTGDALMIRGTGRTDFQEGSPEQLYESIMEKIYMLPNDTIVYPAHNYKGTMSSTIEEEKEYNPRIKTGTTKEEFVHIMNNLNLPEPANIAVAVPANKKCGDA